MYIYVHSFKYKLFLFLWQARLATTDTMFLGCLFVCLFVCYHICKHGILKMNKAFKCKLAQVVHGLTWQGHETIKFGVRWSKVSQGQNMSQKCLSARLLEN